MLSYIDIEAFATASYRVAPRADSKPSLIEPKPETASVSHLQLARKHKQAAKRLFSACKPTRTKQAI